MGISIPDVRGALGSDHVGQENRVNSNVLKGRKNTSTLGILEMGRLASYIPSHLRSYPIGENKRQNRAHTPTSVPKFLRRDFSVEIPISP